MKKSSVIYLHEVVSFVERRKTLSIRTCHVCVRS